MLSLYKPTQTNKIIVNLSRNEGNKLFQRGEEELSVRRYSEAFALGNYYKFHCLLQGCIFFILPGGAKI